MDAILNAILAVSLFAVAARKFNSVPKIEVAAMKIVVSFSTLLPALIAC